MVEGLVDVTAILLKEEVSRLNQIKKEMGDGEWAKTVGESVMVGTSLLNTPVQREHAVKILVEVLTPQIEEIRKDPSLFSSFIDGILGSVQKESALQKLREQSK